MNEVCRDTEISPKVEEAIQCLAKNRLKVYEERI